MEVLLLLLFLFLLLFLLLCLLVGVASGTIITADRVGGNLCWCCLCCIAHGLETQRTVLVACQAHTRLGHRLQHHGCLTPGTLLACLAS